MKKFEELGLSVNDQGRVHQNSKNLEIIKSALNDKSSSLCLAKFTQVTMHLGAGLVHSCHHPKVHKIPLEELENDPAALFNSTILKTARAQMLNGERPEECDYCWRVEDNGNISDRFYKSNEDWAIKNYDNIITSTGQEIFKPTYLEVSFGNACNLKCAYCGPEFSSKWVEELKEHGPLIVTDGPGHTQWVQGWQDLDNITIPNKDHNPYIDAFWKWFPEIYPTLKHYRITGGEPLLNKNTLKSLDYLIENPKEDLELSINTNLSIPNKLWEEFLDKIIKLDNDANFRKITIFTSIESWKEKSAYSRTGIDFDKLVYRFEELLQKTNVRCVVMATYNMLAITSFKDVLEWILELKKKYNYNHHRDYILKETGYDFRSNSSQENIHGFRVGIDIPYLRHPECLDVQYCDDDMLLNHMIPCIEYMISNMCRGSLDMHLGFEPYEVEKFQRIITNRLYFHNKYRPKHEQLTKYRAKFYDFVNEIDRRRNTNFLETFPEMEQFYLECKDSKDRFD